MSEQDHDTNQDTPTTDRGFVIGSSRPEGAPTPAGAGPDFATPDPAIQPDHVETDMPLDQDPV